MKARHQIWLELSEAGYTARDIALVWNRNHRHVLKVLKKLREG